MTLFKDKARFTYRRKTLYFKEVIWEFAEELKQAHFAEEKDSKPILFHVGCLMCPSDMEKFDVFDEWKDDACDMAEVKRVHDTLYKFSMQKVMDLMENKFYKSLFRIYYLALTSGEVSMPEPMVKNRHIYDYAFKILLNEK